MNSLISGFHFFANTFGQIQKYFVYRYSDLTCSINEQQLLSPSQIFDKFELTFELQI
jgi:hypothetical protein